MIRKNIKRIIVLVAAVLCFFLGLEGMVYGKVDASLLTPLTDYPGVKTFDFSVDPIRENISAASMVGAEYSIKLTKEFPDEYFGVSTSQITDKDTGETVTGLFIQRDGGVEAKGNCGCIYRNMFQYKGRWIDVKTTYMDWLCQVKKTAFFCGGFANHRWQSLWYVEMKHEFFLAGTDTPVEVKGYLEYNDIDNSQGILLKPGEFDGIWVNSGETVIGFRNIKANTDIVHTTSSIHQISQDMLCIQAMTNDDIPCEGESGYNRQIAAKTCFAYTFSGDTLHTSLMDDGATGFNVLNNSSKKHVPTAIPEINSPDVSKTVSDEDETDVVSNHVRSWQKWTYRVKAIIPQETEQGNMFDGFTITDSIDPALDILDVKVKRGDMDVSELFDITTYNNKVTAEAINISDADLYGHTYILEIEIRVGATKEEMQAENLLDEECRAEFTNVAQVKYRDGNGEKGIETNKTVTTVEYEKEGNIAITKVIRPEDIYSEHGDAVFMFRLSGTTVSGQKKEYNRAVMMDENIKTVWFRNIPEGKYVCSEYETFRFGPGSITEVTGGVTEDNAVNFVLDGDETYRATFTNLRKSWGDYSDSSLCVNSLGPRNN